MVNGIQSLSHIAVLRCAVLGRCAAASLLSAGPTVPSVPLLVLTGEGVEQQIKPTGDQVSAQLATNAQGISVAITPGKESYPGLQFRPLKDTRWDLSEYGHVEARVVNTGEQPITLSLRVDNAGDWKDNPWNTESIFLEPGASGAVDVIFGYSYGKKRGYALNSSSIVSLLVFAMKSNGRQSFRIESICAAGPAGETPPMDPKQIRIKPRDGILLGPGVTIDASRQIQTRHADAAVVAMDAQQALLVTFLAGKDTPSVALKPDIGRWDLRDCIQVRAKMRNVGKTPVRPSIHVESNGGSSQSVSASESLAPGRETELVTSFISAVPWRGTSDGAVKGAGSLVTSDAVGRVVISTDRADTARQIRITSITADVPPPEVPEWLGKRPPVQGDWQLTFNENFDQSALDGDIWNIYTQNYWDNRSHFSKNNVILGDGVVRLRYEKKLGYHNDDPKQVLFKTKQSESDYATGYLGTYGKWTQRYGYFEARMKLPTAPGLWPAFWMMPDRGKDFTPVWKRSSTEDGGMEFDILEHLTRWGPYRYNIAMHWDGYGKGHKSLGTSNIYVQPDSDGYTTSGLLWLPGELVFYGNGREVARWTSDRVSTVPSYLILYFVSGGWDNNSLDNLQLPSDFVIDYVRVWQRKDLMKDIGR